MSRRKNWRSFAAGELTPELFGRVDLAGMQTGLSFTRNFRTLPHGPAQSRAGLEYIQTAKYGDRKSVFIPFIFSDTQAYVLEFGHLYIRFHTQGGTVLEPAQAITAVTNAAVGVFNQPAHGYNTDDWLYFATITGMSQLQGRFMKVVRLDANNYTLTDLWGVPFDTTALGAFTAGTSARVYEVVSPYTEDDVGSLNYAQANDVLSLCHQSYQQRELRRLGATNWTLSTISFAPTIAAPAAPTVVPNAAGGTSYSYVVTSIAEGTLEESLASAVTTNAACQVLSAAGAFNTITPPAVTGAVRYNVYKLLSGLYGYIGQTDGSGFKDDNITPDTTKTPPQVNDPFTAASKWPGAVGYYGGRKYYGGSIEKPLGLYGTKAGTEHNLSYSIPLKDDDAIGVTFKAHKSQTIRHIIQASDLLILTSSAEWLVEALNSDAITPLTISYKAEDYIGASRVMPCITGGAVLYAQARGGHVRELKYSWNQRGYTTSDISLRATHLFDGYQIVSMAYSHAPSPVSWCVRSDGKLLGLTYVPEQEVLAWHQHDTAGSFESVCVVPEGEEDVAYFIVKRTINNQTVRYIERLVSRRFATVADSFCVDSGLRYSGAAANVISGLWHLVGSTVAVLGDGGTMPDVVVSATGTITLPNGVSVTKAAVGLRYTCQASLLPLSFEAEGEGQASSKNVSHVWLRLTNSSGLEVGPSFDKLTLLRPRSTEPFGSPPALKTGVYKVAITPAWAEEGVVCIEQNNPLPVTLASMALQFSG